MYNERRCIRRRKKSTSCLRRDDESSLVLPRFPLRSFSLHLRQSSLQLRNLQQLLLEQLLLLLQRQTSLRIEFAECVSSLTVVLRSEMSYQRAFVRLYRGSRRGQ